MPVVYPLAVVLSAANLYTVNDAAGHVLTKPMSMAAAFNFALERNSQWNPFKSDYRLEA